MSTDQDAVKRAVVLGVAVISTLLDGAFDALVGIAVHVSFLLLIDCKLIVRRFKKNIPTVAIC